MGRRRRGPRLPRTRDAALLASAYVDVLRQSDEVGARSVAVPSLSTGAYGYPRDEAAVVSVGALRSADTAVEQVMLVAPDERMAQAWEDALRSGS